MNKPGWYGESRRHSLASRGIRSSVQALRQKKYPRIKYNNPRSIIEGFWWANVNRDYSHFDFDKAFKFMKDYIEDVEDKTADVQEDEENIIDGDFEELSAEETETQQEESKPEQEELNFDVEK